MKIHKLSLALVVALAPFEVRQLVEGCQVLILPLYGMERWQGILEQI